MNLGEFIIKIGTQADTKELEKATRALENAEKKTRRLIEYFKELKEATTESEKKLVKKNFALNVQKDKLKAVTQEQQAFSASIQKSLMTGLKFIGWATTTITVLDRLGNSLLKSNQAFINFNSSTDISINRLSRMAGLAKLSNMNMSTEQVASDLQSLQHKIFRLERFGEGAQTFGMLGINPRGMKADKLILSLRKSLKGYSGQIKSEYLSELGLSQEWLTVLNLTDEQFKDYLKTSKELQLSEKERKQLAKYTYIQQKNNMRWELVKQKLLIAIMPLVQKIMEVTSKAALEFSKFINDNPSVFNLIKDILILFTGAKMIRTIKAVNDMVKGFKTLGILGLTGGVAKGAGAAAGGGLLGGILAKKGVRKGIGKVFGKSAAKWAARTAAGHAVAAGAASTGIGAILGAILEVGFAIWGVTSIAKDILDFLKGKDEKEENDPLPEPDENTARYMYHNVNSNMTNNFFNNPQPAKEAISQLYNVQALLLAEQYR